MVIETRDGYSAHGRGTVGNGVMRLRASMKKLDLEQGLIVCITSSLFDILIARAGAFCHSASNNKRRRDGIYIPMMETWRVFYATFILSLLCLNS